MTKKRILTGLRLDKIAVVDRPCQEHATMTIMKRADVRLGQTDISALIKRQAETIAENERKLAAMRAEQPGKDQSVNWDAGKAGRFSTLKHKLETEGSEDALADAKKQDPEGYGDWLKQQASARNELSKRLDEFEVMAQAIEKRDGRGRAAAISTARLEHPTLFAKWQEAGAQAYDQTVAKATAKDDGPADDELKFRYKVDEIKARDKIGHADALAKARRDYPALYKAAYEAA